MRGLCCEQKYQNNQWEQERNIKETCIPGTETIISLSPFRHSAMVRDMRTLDCPKSSASGVITAFHCVV